MNEQDIFKLLEEQCKKISNRHQTLRDNSSISSLKLKCPSGNTAVTYCLSCTNCSVTCVDDDCQKCFRSHLKCERMKKIKQFHAELQETIQPSFIFGEIQQSITCINDSLLNLKKEIQEELKTFKLTQADKEIVKKINDYHQGQGNLQSKDFLQHLQNKPKQKENWFDQETKKFSSIIERSKQMVMKKFQTIHKAIYYEHLENCEVFDEKIFRESKILESRAWKNQMLLLLKELRPIRQVQRIYCASTDGFLSSSFHKQCDNRPNLLYIVRNQFDKTYGGFSPCPISENRGDKYESDQSMSSFVFSLDLHTKSNLVNKQFSIRNSYKPKHKNNVLVAFGNPNSPNLIISENSFGVSRDNWIDMYGGAYEEINDNLEELIGTKQHMMCKLKEFEVFQISFVGEECQSQTPTEDEISKENKTQEVKIQVEKEMDIEKNESFEKVDQVKITQNLEKEVPEKQTVELKKVGRTKQISKPVANKAVKKQNESIKNPGRKPAKKTQEKSKKNNKSEQKRVQKRGRPKKKETQQNQSSSDYYLLDNDEDEGQQNSEQNEEEQDDQQNRRTLLEHLFARQQQRLGPLSFLFGQNNNQEESDSHEGRDWHHHRRHGHHGNWRRHHHW